MNMKSVTHIDDFLHVNPNKLLTPDETLNTSDNNQKRLTTPLRELDGTASVSAYVNWSVVAVTLEKNVAIVVKLTYRVVSLSIWSTRNFGRADSTLDNVRT